MAHLRIETDRGYGWQVRGEGEVPDDINLDRIKAETAKCALNGASRAFLNGVEVFRTKKLTKRQAEKLFGL